MTIEEREELENHVYNFTKVFGYSSGRQKVVAVDEEAGMAYLVSIHGRKGNDVGRFPLSKLKSVPRDK